MNPWLMTLVMLIAWGAFALQISVKLGALTKMAPEKRLDQLGRRISRLFKIGFGQQKLIGRSRERGSGIMHALIFWGAMLVGIRELTLMGEGFITGFQEYLPLLGSDSWLGFAYISVYNVGEVLVLAMILVALYRRIGPRPERLELNWEGIYVLLFIGSMMFTDLLYDAARLNLIENYGQQLHFFESTVYGSEWEWAPFTVLLASALNWLGAGTNAFIYYFAFWGHVAAMLIFVNILIHTKQFHEMTALPNVFLGSLDYPHAIAPLADLEDEKAWEDGRIGVNKLEHLSWKQGLDLFSCTECGRCHEVCPTFVTDKPLTLKWFNQSLLKHLRKEEATLFRTGATAEDKTLVGEIIRPETLWACTTCRACEEVCPVSIEHVPRILGLRQNQTMMEEAYPPEMANTFKGLERNFNPWGIGFDQRADWAEGLNLTMMSETKAEDIDVLMWVGCAGSFDSRNQKIARATATLYQKAGVKFAILGTEEKCTGDLARRSGNEMLFQMLAGENVETLNNYKIKKIVTACPHCLNSIKNEYPQLGGEYEVFHHSQFIAKLVDEGRLPVGSNLKDTITYHDPCYLGRYNNEYDAPRNLLKRTSGDSVREMKRHGTESFCCGAGGARMWMEETIGSRINETRTAEAIETGATTVATGCPFCMTMISDGIAAKDKSETMQAKDVAELVLEAVEGA
ncbi:MAG: (Fe-S)-binding protein [SAR324 cluster bacterium]|nr:(Fe-S)-binding protein [SAR324 cluster bacterium]MBL7036185.1 (Fe-S)-binding protein [SAR324 cluster bacterium]